MQDLTSADAGASKNDGGFNQHEFTNIELEGSRLVDFGWPVERSRRSNRCGGEYESYVDAAINQLAGTCQTSMGVTTVLQGTLYTAPKPRGA